MIFFKISNATYFERQCINMPSAMNFIANLVSPSQESKEDVRP